MQTLIVLNLIAFAFETQPNLPEPWPVIFDNFELVTVILFTGEYLFRLLMARPRSAYAFSFFGIIDLLAIVPYFFALGIDLRTLRAFRMLRLFSLVKLARYDRAIRRYHQAFKMIREELVLFGTAALIVLYLSSVGIYFCEHKAQPEKFASVFDSLWWAICTLTTVGYGDVYPITAGGRVFTFFVLMVGLGFITIPTGLFASALAKARDIG